MLDNTAMTDAEIATRERFRIAQGRAVKQEGYGATAWGRRLTVEFCSPVSEVIKNNISKMLKTRTSWNSPLKPLKELLRVLANVDPDILAAATLRSLLHCIAMDKTVTETTVALGRAIQGECWAKKLLSSAAYLEGRIDRAVRKRHGSVKHRQQAAKVMAARAGYRTSTWSREELLRCGWFMLEAVLEALPDYFLLDNVEGVAKYVRLSETGAALAAGAVEDAITNNPVFLPCAAPPQPWTGFRTGGYWDERTRLSTALIRTPHKPTVAAVKAAMRSGQMEPHVRAVNALQSVAWKINTKVLDVVRWCYEHDIKVPTEENGKIVMKTIKGLPPKKDAPLPTRLSDEDWQNEVKRTAQRTRINKIKERNRGFASDRVLFAQDMATATKLGPEQSFYTPYNCDWRGRVYACCHFNFQRDDRVRALFLFANGMPLGDEGLFWLKVHVANCGDFNKISKQPFEERVKWVDEWLPKIRFLTLHPHSELSKWWMRADKPFLFLAACLELVSALTVGSSYMTCLPISFDGSCSGLQHLCAMTRAGEGSLVNLTPTALPQDVYQTVADLVTSRVAEEAAIAGVGSVASLCLANGITRKLVKRNVMTYSYSSKEYGMAGQHKEDTMRPLELEVLAGERDFHPYAHPLDTVTKEDGTTHTVVGRAAAKYLAKHVYAAIEEVVHLPAEAMAFLQKCSRALAHEGKPLAWITPSGLPWFNRYHTTTTKRVELWMSDVRIQLKMAEEDSTDGPIDKDKAAQGVAPNFVHALDAAHLLLTVNACVAEGIENIATVHDSFGCLAPQAVRFNQIIRETFVKMYESHDVLSEVLECSKRDLTAANWRRLPSVPEYGPLNLKDVNNAAFAFA